jgi:hypothetical protein
MQRQVPARISHRSGELHFWQDAIFQRPYPKEDGVEYESKALRVNRFSRITERVHSHPLVEFLGETTGTDCFRAILFRFTPIQIEVK